MVNAIIHGRKFFWRTNNNNLYLKSLHISTTNICSVELLLRLSYEHNYVDYTELWKCDLLKATTDDAPDGDRTGDPSAQSLMRYRLRQSAPQMMRSSSDLFLVYETIVYKHKNSVPERRKCNKLCINCCYFLFEKRVIIFFFR